MRRIKAGILSCILCMSMIPFGTKAYAADIDTDIIVDGELDDWKEVPSQVSNDIEIKEWKLAKEDDGTLFFCFTGDAVSEWYGNYIWKTISITQAGGTLSGLNFSQYDWSLVQQTGADVVTKNNAHGNSAADYVVEASIPATTFKSGDYIISFAGNDIQSSAIPVISGQTQSKEDAVYKGITIDGKFTDWDAVKRNDAGCPNTQHPDCLEATAMVFDGDYVYIYIKDGAGGDAAGAGSHSNGQYVITTDLGRELVFQLKNNQGGSVAGVEDAVASHVGAQWEIAIPASELPQYQKSLSFGLYQQEPFITGVVNIQEDAGHVGGFEGIIYDGLYGDWTAYPHTRIEYATAGTQEEVVDAEGALYSDGSTLFGHVVTRMPQHLEEAAGEFTSAVTILFNNDYKTAFYPRMVAVDDQGNIDWSPSLKGLRPGTYEFYLASTDAWHTSSNLNDLNKADQMYGKMMITVGETSDECEFYLDLKLIADKFGCDASEFKTIAAQFGRIGQQWLTTAGASSGPWIGLIICGVVVVGAMAFRKYKGRI